jgi:hypothetical protein
MTIVPVFCQNCEALYGANVLEGAILDNTLIGNNPISCPFCGKTGYTIEGLYSNIGKAIEIIVESFNSKQSLSTFAEKLCQLKDKKIDPIQFKTEVPELKKLGDSLPKNRSELYAFIAILLTAISMLISSYTQFFSSQQTISRETIEQIVKESVQENIDESVSLHQNKNKNLRLTKTEQKH